MAARRISGSTGSRVGLLPFSGAVLAMLLVASPVHAGKNANGALIVHTNDSVMYSAGADYCGTFFDNPGSCENAITRTDKDEDTPAIIWVLAAFPADSNPAVTAVQFGLHDNIPEGNWETWHACGPGVLEIPDAGWPQTGKGIAVAYSSARTDSLFPVYWFDVYGFAEPDSAYLGTTNYARGDSLAEFADNSNPPIVDTITRFGTVRWYSAGKNSCPGENQDSGDHQGEEGGSGEDQSSGDTSGGYPDSLATNEVSIRCEPGALVFNDLESTPVPFSNVTFNISALHDTLETYGAITVAKSYPGHTLADTLAYDYRNELVRVPSVARFFRIRFSTAEEALGAEAALAHTPGVRTAEIFYSIGSVQGDANDKYYVDSDTSSWPGMLNPQWGLRNRGQRRAASRCDSARTGMDIQIYKYNIWPLPGHNYQQTLIGIVDMGILDSHSDLPLLALSNQEKQDIQNNYPLDWCGTHATRMAGFAAAKTHNAIGIAGVCDGCKLLDIEVALPGCCASHTCQAPYDWDYRCDMAGSLFLNRGLRVLNFSDEGSPMSQTTLDLYRLYCQGLPMVASHGDHTSSAPSIFVYPACLPFVLGVGGYVHDGRFWEANTSCYESDNGTTVGPGLDICAPACPNMVTTDATGDSAYASTTVQNSGAAALVSGTMGFIQLLVQKDGMSVGLSSDDACGIITATALPFYEDPRQHSSCQTCTLRDYGNGRLDANAAIALAEDIAVTNGAHLTRRVVAAGGTSRRLVSEGRSFEGVHWQLWAIEASVQLPYSARADIPAYVGWANKYGYQDGSGEWVRTTTLAGFDLGDSTLVKWDVRWGLDQIQDCELFVDRNTGSGLLQGFAYRSRANNNAQWVWSVDPDTLQMVYSVWSVSSSEVQAEERATERQRIHVACVPGSDRVSISYWLGDRCETSVSVFDCSGRRVACLSQGYEETGKHLVLWDGRRPGGARVPTGVYFVRVKSNGGEMMGRIVMLR